MGLFRKQDDIPQNDSLIEEIYGELTEREISEIEKNAELEDAVKRAWRNKSRKRIFRNIAVVLLLVGLTLGVVITGYLLLFNISEFHVEGETPYTDEEIFAAAGVKLGDGLFSFSSVKAGERLSANLPGISELKVDRHIPNGVTFKVKYEVPVYYTEIYGKIYLMSETLRVLGEAAADDTEGLIWLRLPGIKEITFGSKPVLRNIGAGNRMTEITEIVRNSELADRVTQIDVRSSYELNIICDNKYLLYMGDYVEVATKLRIADAVLADEMFENENKARLDLTNMSETAVLVDNNLDFTK